MRERVRELRARSHASTDGEGDVRAKIAEMSPADRAIAEGLHEIVRTHAPSLTPRTWYGMPAYSKDDEVLCYFRPAGKFKTRYAVLGFSDAARLDDGRMWPTEFALREMTSAEEERIVTLLKRALG